jgi:hypothetical protein
VAEARPRVSLTFSSCSNVYRETTSARLGLGVVSIDSGG